MRDAGLGGRGVRLVTSILLAALAARRLRSDHTDRRVGPDDRSVCTAALLYRGAALSAHLQTPVARGDAAVRRTDAPWIVAIVVARDEIAPALLAWAQHAGPTPGTRLLTGELSLPACCRCPSRYGLGGGPGKVGNPSVITSQLAFEST